jgi:hypothetical protein
VAIIRAVKKVHTSIRTAAMSAGTRNLEASGRLGLAYRGAGLGVGGWASAPERRTGAWFGVGGGAAATGRCGGVSVGGAGGASQSPWSGAQPRKS